MWDTSARLLRLLSLLQSRRDWSGTELADRLEITTRTVRRDIDKLRSLGYPITAAPGVAGGYRLGAGASLPPLLLDDDEALAVAVGLRTAASGSIAGVAEASVRALAKLEQVLPAHLRHRVSTLNAVVVALTPGGTAVDPDVLTAVAAACRDHLRLRFDYQAHDGTRTVRVTEPHRLVHGGRWWYLVAYDVERADWRTFRLDRMTPRVPTGPRFTPSEPPQDAATYVSHSVASAPYRYRAKILVHSPIEVVADQASPTSSRLEAVDDQRCLLYVGSHSLDEIVLYVGLKGIDFEILEPPELIDRARALAEIFRRAAP